MPRGTKVSDSEFSQVQKLRDSGMTVRDIAKKLKLNYWQTYSRLRKLGAVKTRSARGGASRAPRGRRRTRSVAAAAPRNGLRGGGDMARWARAIVGAGLDPVTLAAELLKLGR
jgi:hypothetical protein